MVKIDIWYNKEKDVVACKLSGHANSAKKGQDIVCAGISALTQTALLGLIEYAKADVDYEMSDGNMQFSLKTVCDKTQAILQTMLLGLEQIAKQYEKNVKIEYHWR